MSSLPTRSCCVCGKKAVPKNLVRVASQSGAAPQIGAAFGGRGAYVCATLDCLEKAFGRKSFERALKLVEPLNSELKAELRTLILARTDSPPAGEYTPATPEIS